MLKYVAARWRGISNAMNESVPNLRHILATLEVEMTNTVPHVANSTVSTANQ